MSGTDTYLFSRFADRPEPLPGIYLDRNWHLASEPIWSRSPEATLAVSAEAFPEPVPLILRLHVFGATPAKPRKLTIRSAGQTDQVVNVATQDAISVRLMTPAHAEDARYSPITLALDTVTSPILDGVSIDERCLGVAICDLQQTAHAVSNPIDCTVPAQAAQVLGKGWAAPEAGSGVWTLGTKADLVLPGYTRPSAPVHLTLEAIALGRPAERPPLAVELTCGGRPVTAWHLPPDSADTLSCTLPGWTENVDCHIGLRLTDVLSPAELGVNSDTRLLGLHLRRITLVSA